MNSWISYAETTSITLVQPHFPKLRNCPHPSCMYIHTDNADLNGLNGWRHPIFVNYLICNSLPAQLILNTCTSGLEFVKGSLIREVNGTVLSTSNEGLLSVRFVNRHNGEETHGTVCTDNFNWRTATTFCRYFGYRQGEWDSERVDTPKYDSQYVSSLCLRLNAYLMTYLD